MVAVESDLSETKTSSHMKNSQYSASEYIYILTDAELIHAAGEILGSHRLNLSLKEAIDVILSSSR